ncbi:putative protease Do-like 14 isoform X2 [Capsicum galapagoense]
MVHLSDGRSFDGQIEAYDLYYNIAAVQIQSDTPLPTASLAHLNDSITVDPSHSVKEEPFQLRPHSNSLNLIPEDLVIVLGRFPIDPYSIMAAPGLFSINHFVHCLHPCKELFMTSCRITQCGIGGPLISRSGEVIGISLEINSSTTAFLPINIASIWWEHYEKHGQTQQLWFGMEVTNLYAAPLDVLESIIQKFPDVLEGVIVEDVVRGSSAESAGIKQHDVIIQFSGKRIQSFLELFENMWNKVGEAVELVVVRASDDVPLHLSMVVEKEVKKSGYTLYDYDE